MTSESLALSQDKLDRTVLLGHILASQQGRAHWGLGTLVYLEKREQLLEPACGQKSSSLLSAHSAEVSPVSEATV